MLHLKDLLLYFAIKRKECEAVVTLTEADERKQNLKVQEEMMIQTVSGQEIFISARFGGCRNCADTSQSKGDVPRGVGLT